MITKIISGGQTGADRAALDAAIKLDIPHGGWVPKGRLTEDGPIPDTYKLQEMPTESYADRTKQNIIDSDGTLIVSHGQLTGGSKLTKELANELEKPCLHIDLNSTAAFQAAVEINRWIQENRIGVLNVAGPRASKDPKIYNMVLSILETVYYMDLSAEKPEVPQRTSVPRTVKEAVDRLIKDLPLKDRTIIANMHEDELINLHFSLGMYIRNNFGLWAGKTELMEDCRRVAGNQNLHEDDASTVIILEVWRKLKESHRLRVV